MRLMSELFHEEFIKKLPESLRRDRELDFLWDQIEENIENKKGQPDELTFLAYDIIGLEHCLYLLVNIFSCEAKFLVKHLVRS